MKLLRPGAPLSRRLGPTLALAFALLAVAAPATSQQTALAAGAAAAESFVVDQICWAYYDPHEAWYAAQVVEVREDSIRVRHFDGFEETVTPNRVMRDRVSVGDTLGAFFRDDAEWYSAVIIERRGMEVTVEYSEGTRDETWLRWLRIRAEPPTGG